MSEQVKHTPGPWLVHDRWYIGTAGEGIRTHAEVKCCVNVPAHDHEQHEANARLIAAAPDLLAALQEAEAMLLVAMRRDLEFDRDTQTTIIDGHAGMVKIRAAIAKAKGESK